MWTRDDWLWLFIGTSVGVILMAAAVAFTQWTTYE